MLGVGDTLFSRKKLGNESIKVEIRQQVTRKTGMDVPGGYANKAYIMFFEFIGTA